MAIIKTVKFVTDFTMLHNESINDNSVSLEAKGLWVYLMSKPTDWVVRPSEIKKRFDIGRDKFQRIILELITTGYASRELVRGDGQQWDGYDYTIYDIKNMQAITPQQAEPEPVQPEPENQHLTNKDNILIKTNTNTILNSIISEQSSERTIGTQLVSEEIKNVELVNEHEECWRYLYRELSLKQGLKPNTNEIFILKNISKRLDNNLNLIQTMWSYLVQDDFWSEHISVANISKHLAKFKRSAEELMEG
jgi:hypothetical protein